MYSKEELIELRKYREQIIKSLDVEKVEPLKHERPKLHAEILNTISKHIDLTGVNISSALISNLCDVITDEITSFGPLHSLMEDESISDILVNGPSNIYVERNGLLEKTNKVFLDNDQLTDIAKRLISRVGRRIDESQPLVDARMPDGSRINVIIPPLSIDGTSLSIRKFGNKKKSLEDLVIFGTMTEKMAKFLMIACLCRANIIISGGTGSGKTTLLNALSEYISTNERIVTLEDAAELKLQQPHVVRLETRLAGAENHGKVDMRQLLVNSLRMRPDRIIVGECRGEEAFEMLQAMNTGHDGSMSTLHANSARDALSRLESMIMMSKVSLPLTAIRRNISSAVNIIIQVSRLPDGSRKIISVSEIMGMEGDDIVLYDIFSFKARTIRDSNNKLLGDFEDVGILLQRSVIYRNAVMYDLVEPLAELFGTNI